MEFVQKKGGWRSGGLWFSLCISVGKEKEWCLFQMKGGPASGSTMNPDIVTNGLFIWVLDKYFLFRKVYFLK